MTKQAASSILDTGIKMVRNVGSFNFGRGAIADAAAQVEIRRQAASVAGADNRVVFLVDEFFRTTLTFTEGWSESRRLRGVCSNGG